MKPYIQTGRETERHVLMKCNVAYQFKYRQTYRHVVMKCKCSLPVRTMHEKKKKKNSVKRVKTAQ